MPLEANATPTSAVHFGRVVRRLGTCGFDHGAALSRRGQPGPNAAEPPEPMQSPKIAVSGITIAWQPGEGTCTFEGLPVAMMWVDTTLKGLMEGVRAMVGTKRYQLALQAEGRNSVEQDWEVISRCPTFEEGFRAIATIAAVAGWGRWELLSIDRIRCECRFRATSTWESRFCRATGVQCESAMLAGKLAGYGSKLFGFNCWADQVSVIARGDAYDEFYVHRSDRTVEDEIQSLVRSDEATRRDLAAALEQLRRESARTRASEARLQAVFEHANDGLILTKDGVIVDANRKALEMFGCTRDEFRGRSPPELSPRVQPDGMPSSRKGREKMDAALAGDAQVFEWRHRRLDGTPFDTEVSLNRVELPDGLHLQSVLRDISERKRAAAQLRLFKLATDSSTDLVAAVDREYKYLFANRAYLDWHHKSDAQVAGCAFSDIIGEEPFQRLKPQLDRCLRGENVRFETTREYPELGIRHMEASYFPLRGNDAVILGVVGIARDVTSARQAETALQYEADFRKVLGEISNHLISLAPPDIDAGINRALGAAGEFVGADRSYVLRFDSGNGTSITTHEWCRDGVVSPGNLRGLSVEGYEAIVEELVGRFPVAIPDVGRMPNGPARRALEAQGIRSMLLIPLPAGGRFAGTVGFEFVRATRELAEKTVSLLEFTAATLSSALERQRMEGEKARLEEQLRQSQKMEAVGRLAGGVAHDFNNMLCAIMGQAELLLGDLPADHTNRDAIGQIVDAARRAANLTQQLLAFSRKQVVQPRLVDLNSVVENLHPMLARLIGEHIRLRTSSSSATGRVRVDPNQVEQIVVNLAVNARDAMPQGGELVIETIDTILDEAYCNQHPNARPGRYVMLAVSDTGCGMTAEVRERVFEPFFTTKEMGRGTGLGLATVHGIVEQSGGRIEVYSELGKGTSFKVYFRRADDERPASEVVPVASEMEGGPETVLVVEDEEVVRHLAEKALRRLGYTVLVAASGDEAIAAAKAYRERIHLLLTDVVMPRMDGRELARCLRELIPGIKVLYASGYTQDVIAHHGVIDDRLEFLPKPYTVRLLGASVRRALDAEERGGG
jgi:PAS domain S-box-containing protein